MEQEVGDMNVSSPHLPAVKVAVVSSYTVDLIVRDAAQQLKNSGSEVEWFVTPFGQYRQEILSNESALLKFQPNVILIALHGPELVENSLEISDLLMAASSRFATSTILVHNCALLLPLPMKFLEWNSDRSVRRAAAEVNVALSQLVSKLPNVHLLDLEELVSRYGAEKMYDARLYYLAKMQFSPFGTQAIATQLAWALLAIGGRRKKCLILDLDNTLWGGILGEDGVEHLRLSSDGEGKAFHDFQRHILALTTTGTILAICSKNDETPALQAMDSHPDMILRKEHFAAIRINWLDKSQNIRSIAEELNIGLDALVFLDDSPQERELVRIELPAVTVPDLPNDPSAYPAFLASLPYFETFSVTEEDASRRVMYAQERQRKEIQEGAKSVEEALMSLQIKVLVQSASAFTIPRIAQLTQKTNQFNLSTKRYTEAEIRALSSDPHCIVLCVSASDRLGDSGIVGVAILKTDTSPATIDTLLMSCRVLGRGIEQALVSVMQTIAQRHGTTTLAAEYVPTKKNGMVKKFLTENGFVSLNDQNKFVLEKSGEVPRWIKVQYEEF
ncbi:MAG TPA: HAD-IIIC family phosphatase [Bacteroidota bacterium]|nr:HAD-IIIC family phosphatase [Bacteroidota bacterium]